MGNASVRPSSTRSWTASWLGAEAAEVEAALATAPEDLRLVRQISDLNERLHQHYAPVLAEPVPARLAALAGRIGRARRFPAARQARALAAMATALACRRGSRDTWRAAALEGEAWRQPAFVASALSAHKVFVPEVRHPVEVGAAEEKHLVQWLTRRLGAEVRAPELGGHGWKLVGGRYAARPRPGRRTVHV